MTGMQLALMEGHNANLECAEESFRRTLEKSVTGRLILHGQKAGGKERDVMNKQKKQVQELAQNVEELRRENVKLRGWLAEAIGKACFNCEEYAGHKEERCAKCRIHGMMEYR